jgi:hypothetical protein
MTSCIAAAVPLRWQEQKQQQQQNAGGAAAPYKQLLTVHRTCTRLLAITSCIKRLCSWLQEVQLASACLHMSLSPFFLQAVL